MVLAGVLAAAIGALPAGTAVADPAPLSCRYVVTTSWSTGFSADLHITNRSDAPVTGWTADWSFTIPTRLITVWSAVMTQPTDITMEARNVSWNLSIPAGKTISFGWTALAPVAEIPTDIQVNGVPC
jgi:hypothetical protein